MGGEIEVYDNGAVVSFELPALTSVGDSLVVNYNAALTSFALPELTTVGGGLIVGSQGEFGLGNPETGRTRFFDSGATSIGPH